MQRMTFTLQLEATFSLLHRFAGHLPNCCDEWRAVRRRYAQLDTFPSLQQLCRVAIWANVNDRSLATFAWQHTLTMCAPNLREYLTFNSGDS